MSKQILLPDSIKQELNQTFKAGRNELNRALTYAINSDRAKMLRAAALVRGGLIFTGSHAPNGYCPDVATTYDHAKGLMSQSFGSRLKLDVWQDANRADIVLDGEQIATLDNMTLVSWGNALYSLQLIYDKLNG